MKKLKIYGGVYLLLLLAAIGVYYLTSADESQAGDTAAIIQDGKILHTIDLAQVDKAYQLDIPYKEHTNTILVEPNKISIIKADCPDKICVQMGALRKDSPPIVCLPHRLTIQFTDNAVDAAAN